MSARRTMKRLSICLVLGAATTVAIAWGIALRGVEWSVWRTNNPAAMPVTGADRTGSYPAVWVFWPKDRGIGWTVLNTSTWVEDTPQCTALTIVAAPVGGLFRPLCVRVQQIPEHRHPSMRDGTDRREMHFGLPMRCLWGAHDESNVDTMMDLGTESVLMLRTSPPGSWVIPFMRASSFASGLANPSTAVPIGLLPLGFAVDCAAFSGAWFVVLFGLAHLRRTLRTRRGMCPRCGYCRVGLAGGAVCPECGRNPSGYQPDNANPSAGELAPPPHTPAEC